MKISFAKMKWTWTKTWTAGILRNFKGLKHLLNSEIVLDFEMSSNQQGPYIWHGVLSVWALYLKDLIASCVCTVVSTVLTPTQHSRLQIEKYTKYSNSVDSNSAISP